LQAQNTHISEAVKKILQKKHARVPGWAVNVRVRGIFTAETPSRGEKIYFACHLDHPEECLFLEHSLYECHSERSRPIC
jgi:hypothetical protein